MEHKEQIAQYLSGCAGSKAERQLENALMRSADIFESFVEEVEKRLYSAPSDLADTVMRLVSGKPTETAKVPVLSKRLCAAVCFCSAAAIMLITFSGYDRQIVNFVVEQAQKLGAWISIS